MNELNEVYRHAVHNKRPTIKQTIEAHVKTLEPGIRLFAHDLWWSLFQYQIARNSVTRALGQLAKEGKVEKSTWSGGRGSEWKVL